MIVVSAVIGISLTIIFCLNREPSYQGKSLREWLQSYDQASKPEREQVDEAIRSMGKSAVPQLVRMIRANDRSLKTKANELLKKQRLIKFRFQMTPIRTLWHRGFNGLAALGPKAEPSVPALIKSLDDPLKLRQAMWVLGRIGPGASDAVPKLLQQIRGPDNVGAEPWLAAAVLAEIGESSREGSVKILTNTIERVTTRIRAAWALAMMEPPVKEAMPLLHLLRNRDEDLKVVRAALNALGRIGIDSESTTSDLCDWLRGAYGLEVSNRLENGTFRVATASNGAERAELAPGSTELAGWMTYGGVTGVSDHLSPREGNTLELGSRDPPGCVQQTFLTHIGQEYELSFYAARGRNDSGEVSAGNLRVTFKPLAESYSFFAYQFKATSALTTLSFRTDGREGFGPFLSAVRVEPLPR